MSASALDGREAVARVLARAQDAGAHSADTLFVESDSLEARVRGERIDFVKQSRDRALGIRAFVAASDGLASALTSTSDLSPDALDRMADETVALARATAPDPHAGLPDTGFADDTPELGLLEPADRDVSPEARIDDARRAEQAAHATDARIRNSEGSQVGSHFGHVVYANSAGFTGDFASASHSLFSEPVAADNGAMQRDHWITAGRRLAALDDPARVGRKAAQRALARLGAKRVETCEVPVVFEPLTARSLVGHLASCVGGYALYRGASFLADRLGDTIAAPAVSVVDDGRLPGELGSRPFDGEGLPTRRTEIVTGGRLASYLLDTYSARKLGLRSTGNASRGAGSSPGVGPTNLWLEPGDESLDDIVARTERGLLVTELIGMGFNAVTGDYSRGAAGLWIEDGRIAHPVEEITIASHFAEMLAGIDAIGSDLLRVGRVAAPSVRIARMTVAGA